MQKAIIFTILLITVITAVITIMIGCGGDNNIVAPNIYTPTPEPGKFAYITVRVKWPSRGEEGSYTISSGDEKSVTTERIPADTYRLLIKVLEPNGDPNDPNAIIVQGGLETPEEFVKLKVSVPVIVDNDPNTALYPTGTPDPNTPSILPFIKKVKIRAESYDKLHPDIPLSVNELIKELKLGPNPISLVLGDYKLVPTETIVYQYTPIILSSKLEITDPNDPNNTPLNPTPIVGKTIKFTVSEPNEPNNILDGNSILFGVTDANGVAEVSYMYTSVEDPNSREQVQINSYFLKSQNQTKDEDPNDIICWNCYITGLGLIWEDTFETYASQSWPSTWTGNGNASGGASTGNYVDGSRAYNGSKSLRIFGRDDTTWGSLAHRILRINPPFEIRVKLMTGSETLSGHPFRGRIAISRGPSWSYQNVTLLRFYQSNIIYAGWSSYVLGSYKTYTWYSIRIQCRPSSVSYWIREEPKGASIQGTLDVSTVNYPYLTLESGGGTSWFDDVQIYSLSTTPSAISIHENLWVIQQELYEPTK